MNNPITVEECLCTTRWIERDCPQHSPSAMRKSWEAELREKIKPMVWSENQLKLGMISENQQTGRVAQNYILKYVLSLLGNPKEEEKE